MPSNTSPFPLPSPKRILCLGAHADDIEIGCGGSLLRLSDASPNVEMQWIVFSGSEVRALEAQASAAFMREKGNQVHVEVLGFRDGYFPSQYAELKDAMFASRERFAPDLIFTHHIRDAHQDHRTIAELTWQAFRQATILEYEIPKWESDLGQPNLHISLTAAQAKSKAAWLLESFPSQHEKPWFTAETFLSMLRLRGIQSGCPTGFAEAFHARKLHF